MIKRYSSPVGCVCIISLLYLNRRVDVFPGYNTKQSDDNASVMEISGMWSTPSLPLLLGLRKPKVVTLDRVLSMGQIEQIMCKQMTNFKV